MNIIFHVSETGQCTLISDAANGSCAHLTPQPHTIYAELQTQQVSYTPAQWCIGVLSMICHSLLSRLYSSAVVYGSSQYDLLFIVNCGVM